VIRNIKNGGGINYAWTLPQGKLENMTLWWYEGATGQADLCDRLNGYACVINSASKPKGLRTSNTMGHQEAILGSKVTVRKSERIIDAPEVEGFSQVDVLSFKEQIGVNTLAKAIADLRAEGLNVKLINSRNPVGSSRVGRFASFVERHCDGKMIDEDYYNQIVETSKAVFDGTDQPEDLGVATKTGLVDFTKVNETELASKKPVSKIVRKKARRENQTAA